MQAASSNDRKPVSAERFCMMMAYVALHDMLTGNCFARISSSKNNKAMKIIAKTIDNFHFIGYYYLVDNDKRQL
jgi:hypothetical protein